MTLGCVFTSNPLGCIWSGFPWWVQWGLPALAVLTIVMALWHLFSIVRGFIGPWAALSAVGAILLAVAGILWGRKTPAAAVPVDRDHRSSPAQQGRELAPGLDDALKNIFNRKGKGR